MMATLGVVALQRANARLSSALVALRRDSLRALKAGLLTALRGELSFVDTSLRAAVLEHAQAEPVAAELLLYRSHLRTLAAILPSLQGQMLAERCRLQALRERQERVQAWVDAHRCGE